jgi:hypothetical protein
MPNNNAAYILHLVLDEHTYKKIQFLTLFTLQKGIVYPLPVGGRPVFDVTDRKN